MKEGRGAWRSPGAVPPARQWRPSGGCGSIAGMTPGLDDSAKPAIVMQGPLGQLRELERVLGRAGIPAEVVRPPDCDANT